MSDFLQVEEVRANVTEFMSSVYKAIQAAYVLHHPDPDPRAIEEVQEGADAAEMPVREYADSLICGAHAMMTQERQNPNMAYLPISRLYLERLVAGAEIAYWGAVRETEHEEVWEVVEYSESRDVIGVYRLTLHDLRSKGMAAMMADDAKRSRTACGVDFLCQIIEDSLASPDAPTSGDMGDWLIQYTLFGGQRYC